MFFKARRFKFEFPRPAMVVGVVNVTPDSFSDAGETFDTAAAIARGEQQAREGAEIIDVGGESTRPGAEPVSEAEELRRVIPVIEMLSRRLAIPVSVDTMKPAVARAALEAGASIVNDVAANREDDAMARLVAEYGGGYVVMHMQGTPPTMQRGPRYRDVVAEVRQFFVERLERLGKMGVARDQVLLDVGIGFGKTLDHNLKLLGALESFTNLGRPMLLGVSRKSFIGKLSGGETDRRPGSLACAVLAVEAGVKLIRTHDVAETVQALRVAEAVLSHKK